MAESSHWREGRPDRPERISIDQTSTRGRSQERRVPRPYVRPTAEDDTDDADYTPGTRTHHGEARSNFERPSSRPYPSVLYPRAVREPPQVHDRDSYYYERAHTRGRDYGQSSPPRQVPLYYRPGPNFPRPTPLHPPPERASLYYSQPRSSSPAHTSNGNEFRRRQGRRHYKLETSDFKDDDGGHYNRPNYLPDRVCREAEPTPTNQQVTTSSYYDGSGNRAWTRKNQERSGLGPPPELLVNPLEPAPEKSRYA